MIVVDSLRGRRRGGVRLVKGVEEEGSVGESSNLSGNEIRYFSFSYFFIFFVRESVSKHAQRDASHVKF